MSDLEHPKLTLSFTQYLKSDSEGGNDPTGPQVDCSARNAPGSVDFTFASKTIKVALRDFIVVTSTFVSDGSPAACALGISLETKTTDYILGDSFLRAAYVVHDLTNNQLLLAQSANCEIGRAHV